MFIPDPATLATSMSTCKRPPFYISGGLQLHIHHDRQVYEMAGVHTTKGHFSHTSYAHSFVGLQVWRACPTVGQSLLPPSRLFSVDERAHRQLKGTQA